MASQSIKNYGNDVEMENIIQEEEKDAVAVPNFGNLESDKNFGKRSS